MEDYNLTTTGLAEKIGVSRQTVNDLMLERRAVSPAMTLWLARPFGNTSEFWLNAQRAIDLWNAKRENKQEAARIKPLHADRLRSKLRSRSKICCEHFRLHAALHFKTVNGSRSNDFFTINHFFSGY